MAKDSNLAILGGLNVSLWWEAALCAQADIAICIPAECRMGGVYQVR